MARVRSLARSSLTVLCIVGLMAVGSAPAGVGNPIVEQVSGGGETTFEFGPITDTYEWEVIAKKRFDGSVSGDAVIGEFRSDGRYRIDTVDVQCLRVIGDTAIVSGLVTSRVSNIPSTPVPHAALWAIRDGGNGAGKDQVSYYFFSPIDGVNPSTWCERSLSSSIDWDRGNFRVRG